MKIKYCKINEKNGLSFLIYPIGVDIIKSFFTFQILKNIKIVSEEIRQALRILDEERIKNKLLEKLKIENEKLKKENEILKKGWKQKNK